MAPRIMYRPKGDRWDGCRPRGRWVLTAGTLETGLTPYEASTLLALASTRAHISKAELIDALYGDDPDGGPDFADSVVKVHICRLRRKLAPYGWKIDTEYNRGYALQEAA